MDVDDIGLRVEMVGPDLFQQHGPRHALTGVAHKEFEELKFARLQVDQGRLTLHLTRDQVHFQIADAQDGLHRVLILVLAPAQRLDAGDQFGQGVGLDEIVVGAGAQSRDPVFELAQGRQEQYRHIDAIGAQLGWQSFGADSGVAAAQEMIEAIGILAAAVVALQIAETIIEEEVVRDADISAPTRVRRFLSRFFVVVVVALAIEALVATFHAVHEDAGDLLYVAALVAGIGLLLAAWGVFVHLNRSAEELEPEAMKDAQAEDEKVKP